MIKYFCNKCDNELKKNEIKPLTVSTSRIIPKYITVSLHLCNKCLIEFIGKEEMEHINETYSEFLKKRDERRKAREGQ